MNDRKLFCEYNALFYQISLHKEYLKRYFKDKKLDITFSKISKSEDSVDFIIKSHQSALYKELQNVDMELQKNKVNNLEIAIKKIDNIIIYPNETFSFWKLVGKCTKSKGYMDGLTISNGKLGKDIGGGLCQLANLIHWLVLHSPLTITEHHHHTDALFPDKNRRVPFGTGTSIFYNNVDYRFKNETKNPYRLKLWLTDINLCGELYSTEQINYIYKIIEEDSYYAKEDDEKFYRNSRIYRIVIDKKTKETINKELILINHSPVLYDYDLIPSDEIRG